MNLNFPTATYKEDRRRHNVCAKILVHSSHQEIAMKKKYVVGIVTFDLIGF